MGEIKSISVSSWGLVLLSFLIMILGVEEVIHLASADVFGKFYIPGGNIAMSAFVVSLAMCLLTYWNGNKKFGMVFAWISVFMIGMVPLAGNDIAFLALDPMGYGIGLGHQGLVLGIALAMFTVILAIWVILNDRKEIKLPIFLILLAFLALAEMAAGYQYEDIAGGDTGTYDAIKGVAGVVAIVAAILGMYIGFTSETAKEQKVAEIKSFNVASMAGLTIGFALLMLGISAVMSKSYDDYVVPVFYFVVLGVVLSFVIILSFWNGDKKTTVACLLSLLFFVFLTFLHGNLKTILSLYYYDVFPVFLPSLALGVFLIGIGIKMLAKTNLPKLYVLALALAAVSIIVLGCGQFAKGDDGLGMTLQLVAGIFEICLGLIATYVGFAKGTAGKLPLP